MDVLDGDLEAVEAAGFGDLHLTHEVFYEVFVDDAVGRGEKSEDVLDEVLFVVGEFVPVSEVPGKVYFFSCPETGLGFLVHFPDVGILDWQNYEPGWIFCEKRLQGKFLCLFLWSDEF